MKLWVAACGLFLLTGGLSGCGTKNGDWLRTGTHSGGDRKAPSASSTAAPSGNLARSPVRLPPEDAPSGDQRTRAGFMKLGTGVFVDLAGRGC